MSKKIEWDDSFLLGINEIDLQHKKLLVIANELYDIASIEEDKNKYKLPKVLKSLSDYTEYHFRHEEMFIKRYGYPLIDAHKERHDGFIDRVLLQIKKLSASNNKDAIEFYTFIVEWILNHIANEDKNWAKFVAPQLKT